MMTRKCWLLGLCMHLGHISYGTQTSSDDMSSSRSEHTKIHLVGWTRCLNTVRWIVANDDDDESPCVCADELKSRWFSRTIVTADDGTVHLKAKNDLLLFRFNAHILTETQV